MLLCSQYNLPPVENLPITYMSGICVAPVNEIIDKLLSTVFAVFIPLKKKIEKF